MVLEVLLFVSYHCCHNPCFHIDASNHCCRCWLSCCLEVAEVKLYYWHFACLLWVVVCSSFVGYACWTPIPKWKVCKLMFCSFLLCWLCWLGLLWIMTSTSCTSSLYEVLSSKFVEPADETFNVASRFVVQSSSILYHLAPDVGLTIVVLSGISFVTSGPSCVCCGM